MTASTDCQSSSDQLGGPGRVAGTNHCGARARSVSRMSSSSAGTSPPCTGGGGHSMITDGSATVTICTEGNVARAQVLNSTTSSAWSRNMQELKAEKPTESPVGSDPVTRLMQRLREEGFTTDQPEDEWNNFGEVIFSRREYRDLT